MVVDDSGRSKSFGCLFRGASSVTSKVREASLGARMIDGKQGGTVHATHRSKVVPEPRVLEDPLVKFASKNLTTQKVPNILAEEYELGRVIGEGAFGTVVLGRSLSTQEMVAVKREPTGNHRPYLKDEIKYLNMLAGVAAVPSVLWHGVADGHHHLVMELLGLSLDDLMQSCGDRFSLKTVLMLADQMVVRLEELHGLCIVHRDVKPENFAMGRGSKATIVHLIDLGLSKMWMDPISKKHIEPHYDKNLSGTLRYASLRAHCSEQSRRDDLESLGYTLVFLLKGSLPWQSLEAPVTSAATSDTCASVRKAKMKIPVEDLCCGCPPEFCEFIHRCRKLSFKEPPNYNFFRGLFKQAMASEGFLHDFQFDWKTDACGESAAIDVYSFDNSDECCC
mmetsp:Transcript_33010/g.88516  ORF Transcript_33010/g.88516 Transcript_33010/m.88516 type:complete len:393 (-) Transcript_33010:190-1368(-)